MEGLTCDWNLHFMFLESFIDDTWLAWCIITLKISMNCSHEWINLTSGEVYIHPALQMFSRYYELYYVPGRTQQIFCLLRQTCSSINKM